MSPLSSTKVMSHVSVSTVKVCDHIFSAGHLVADAVKAQRSSSSAFISAPFSLISSRCLAFSYQITGGSDHSISELRVSLLSPFISKSHVLWRMARQQVSPQTARLTLAPSSQSVAQISFEVQYGGDSSVQIYLDDITLTDSSCSVPRTVLIPSLLSASFQLKILESMCVYDWWTLPCFSVRWIPLSV